MNGIYDFEGYRTPYLDVEMLMERKEAKKKRRLVILAVIMAILSAVLAVVLLCAVVTAYSEMLVAAHVIFAVYLVSGVILTGVIVRKLKGDNLCLAWQI